MTPATRAHLSVLLGLIMLAKAWGYYLGRFDLLGSTRGVVQGASYTDVHAQLPALNFLMIAALICAVLFLVNIRVRLWSLPVIAVALLALVSVLLGTAYPSFVQRFRVAPQEFQREQPYIDDNIEGTRRGVRDRERRRHHPADATLRAAGDGLRHQGQPGHDRQHPPVAPVRHPGELPVAAADPVQYYEFRDVDVDRYTLDGERRVVMVSGREVSQAGIPGGRADLAERAPRLHPRVRRGGALVNQATAEGAPEPDAARTSRSAASPAPS